MDSNESESWSLGISETGDKFHLIFYDQEEGEYKPLCKMNAKNMRPIAKSEIKDKVRVCTNCSKIESPQDLLTEVEVNKYSVSFENPAKFRDCHPTTEE